MNVKAEQIAAQEDVDRSTVMRWTDKGCPVVRRGKRGPGNGALFDPEAVKRWLEKAAGPAPAGLLTAEEALLKIAEALLSSLDTDSADIRAGISRADAAAALVVVWERCCKSFGVAFKFDQQPEPICALFAYILDSPPADHFGGQKL